jgi:Mn2+/Fe2+ NRAMP family transporter
MMKFAVLAALAIAAVSAATFQMSHQRIFEQVSFFLQGQFLAYDIASELIFMSWLILMSFSSSSTTARPMAATLRRPSVSPFSKTTWPSLPSTTPRLLPDVRPTPWVSTNTLT